MKYLIKTKSLIVFNSSLSVCFLRSPFPYKSIIYMWDLVLFWELAKTDAWRTLWSLSSCRFCLENFTNMIFFWSVVFWTYFWLLREHYVLLFIFSITIFKRWNNSIPCCFCVSRHVIAKQQVVPLVQFGALLGALFWPFSLFCQLISSCKMIMLLS